MKIFVIFFISMHMFWSLCAQEQDKGEIEFKVVEFKKSFSNEFTIPDEAISLQTQGQLRITENNEATDFMTLELSLQTQLIYDFKVFEESNRKKLDLIDCAERFQWKIKKDATGQIRLEGASLYCILERRGIFWQLVFAELLPQSARDADQNLFNMVLKFAAIPLIFEKKIVILCPQSEKIEILKLELQQLHSAER